MSEAAAATPTWNQIFAVVMLVWAFGWTGGKILVRTSYSEAKVKLEEQKEARAEKKAAKYAGEATEATD